MYYEEMVQQVRQFCRRTRGRQMGIQAQIGILVELKELVEELEEALRESVLGLGHTVVDNRLVVRVVGDEVVLEYKL